ncbi:MAG: hypothetical protein NQ081_05610 [Enterobacter cloacae]|nr:hypothetical protein [Enterobacter cloacae]
MITFTKEQLIASAHARIEFAEMMLSGELDPLKERTWSIELELARIALESLKAEPVCVIDQSNLDYLKSGSDADVWPASRTEMGDVLLYRAAPPAPALSIDKVKLGEWLDNEIGGVRPEQYDFYMKSFYENVMPVPVPVPVPVPDSLLSELLTIAKTAANAADECAHAEFGDDSMEHSTAISDWERRAEIVKNSRQKNHHRDYEDYRDRLESVIFSIVRSMAGEEIRKDEVELHKLAVLYINDAKRRLLPSHVMTTEEKGDAWVMRARAISLRNDFWNGKITQSNSPVVQDGWVMVPLEPTKEMIVAGQDALDECINEGFNSDEDGNIYEYTNISSDAPHSVFKSMIAAAPLQGVK